MSRRPSAPPLPPDVQASPIQPPDDDAETAAVMALSDALAGAPPPSQEARDAETAATLALAVAAGASLADAARLANLAGGLVVAKLGTDVVTAADMYRQLFLSNCC